MAERARIAQYFAPLAANEPGSFSLTDDAARLTPPAGQSLIITTDSVIEGVHVLPGATAQQIAQKLVRRNLSDLAAMGATPWRYTLNLHTPHNLPDAWFAEFAAALAAEQATFSMVLIGGDSTSGGTSLHSTMTCVGLLHTAPLLRSNAKAGDAVYISGTIGDAALGLAMLQHSLNSPLEGERRLASDSAAKRVGGSSQYCPPPDRSALRLPRKGGVVDTDFLIDRYHRPQPRLALGTALHSVAHAVIDISDGLATDAAQLATASKVALHLEQARIPLSPAAQHVLQHHPALLQHIFGGDDYELLFTAPVNAGDALTVLGHAVTRIGTVQAGEGVWLDGVAVADTSGWEHD